jgi:hypothetical protein
MYNCNLLNATRTIQSAIFLVTFSLCPFAYGQENNIYLSGDSIQQQQTVTQAAELQDEVDSISQKLNSKIDSLSNVPLPSKEYALKLKQAYMSFLEHLSAINKKYLPGQSLFSKTFSSLDSAVNRKTHFIDSLLENNAGQEIDRNILNAEKTFDANLSKVIPQGQLQTVKIDGIPEISPITELSVAEANVVQIDDVKLKGTPSVEGLQLPGDNLDIIEDKVQAVSTETEQVSADQYADDVGQAAKKRALENESFKHVRDGETSMKKMADEIKPLKDQEYDASKLKEVKKKYTDHLVGKEDIVKKDMDEIAKSQIKYRDIRDSRFLPKRPQNSMKGKPFVQRIAPGLSFQYQIKANYLIDLHPYVGYKISGRFTVGTGWNQRFAYDKFRKDWNSKNRIFGPRAYLDFKLRRGFIAHVETEMMNTFVPSLFIGNSDAGQREWVWGMMSGLKTEYKIYKNLKGTFLIQYNIFNRHFKAPYTDRLNSRIGVEYVLKKKKKNG